MIREIYLTIQLTTIRFSLAVMAELPPSFHQVAVGTAFLVDELKDYIYMKHPELSFESSMSNQFLKIFGAIHTLKQAIIYLLLVFNTMKRYTRLNENLPDKSCTSITIYLYESLIYRSETKSVKGRKVGDQKV